MHLYKALYEALANYKNDTIHTQEEYMIWLLLASSVIRWQNLIILDCIIWGGIVKSMHVSMVDIYYYNIL